MPSLPPSILTATFIAALLLSVALKFWLATRQARHVARHREQVPQAFAATVALAAHQKAADYTLARSRFALLSLAFNAAVLLGWTLLGGLDQLNRWLLDAMPSNWGHLGYQLALLSAFAAMSTLIDLPWELWNTFRIEQRFGFNRMTWKLYISDQIKGLLLGAAIGLPIAALILWLMGAAGNTWWLWAWGTWMGFNLLMLVLYPTVIAPIFNKFEPLADLQLRARVEGLMKRCGFAAKGLFVMDGSRRSAHGNAYFTGFGPAKRVVFYDTLIARLNGAEMEAVLAHELGHFKHKHVMKRVVMMFAVSLFGFALLGWLSNLPGFFLGLGVRPNFGPPNDALALILFMLALPVFSFFFTPLAAYFSRRDEFQADAYACANAGGADLSSALLKLHEDNAGTLTPDPVYARFYYSHPPAAERLAAIALQSPR